MPELPEVETARALLEKHALNKKIVGVTCEEDKIVFAGKSSKEIESSLMGLRVLSIRRKGKYFWMNCDKCPHISFHLGMTGRMIVRGHPILNYHLYPVKNLNAQWPPRFVKLQILFDDDTQIAFTNSRRFGRCRLHRNDPSKEAPINKLGMDPLNAMRSLPDFRTMILSKRSVIKSALLNQSFCAGVGNWICDELCYQTGIHPNKRCNALSEEQIARIHESLQSIVRYAVGVHANYDKFPSNWLFHYRWNKNAKNKQKQKDSFGNQIIFKSIGGRTTAICETLQSKDDGFRRFENDKRMGKIDNVKQKLKRKNKFKLITKTTSKKRKRKRVADDEIIEKKPKRKKMKKESHNPKTHVLSCKGALFPIQSLRRSARLASKR